MLQALLVLLAPQAQMELMVPQALQVRTAQMALRDLQALLVQQVQLVSTERMEPQER